MKHELDPKMVEVALQAQCDHPGLHWADGLSEGMARIYRMKMERALTALNLPAILAEKDALQTKLTQTREAALALVRKLDKCAPHIAFAFVLQEMRTGPYAGPNYAAELEALRQALKILEQTGEAA